MYRTMPYKSDTLPKQPDAPVKRIRCQPGTFDPSAEYVRHASQALIRGPTRDASALHELFDARDFGHTHDSHFAAFFRIDQQAHPFVVEILDNGLHRRRAI